MTKSSIDYMTWLVTNRSDNQNITLKLLKIVREGGDIVRTDAEIRMIVGTLTSICFSLWRAVFLGDFGTLKETPEKPAVKFAEEFLENLILTNNVVFSTDVKYNQWSFRYYMFNAQLTLNWLKENASTLNLVEDFCKPDQDVTIYWRNLHEALAKAVDRLSSIVDQKAMKASADDNPLVT